MKRTLTLFAAIGAFIFCSATLVNSNGPPSMRSGSPGDGASCASCHSGGSTSGRSVTITTSVPATGYVPNTNYTITVTGTGTAGSYGFQATVEGAANAKKGSYTITNAQTKINNTNWVNQTANGTTVKTWTFTWKAPASGSGTLKIYAAMNFANGDGGTSGDAIVTTNKQITEDLTVPVSLLSFNGTSSITAVDLSWQTALELNNDHFEVERAGDEGNWTFIGQVAGKKNTAGTSTYNFKDEAPLVGNNYYRLKQVDANGNYTYIPSIAVLFTAGQAISFQPNIGETVTVFIPQALRYATLEIYDAKAGLRKKIQLSGMDKVQLDRSFLEIGMYYARIAGSVEPAQKFVIF